MNRYLKNLLCFCTGISVFIVLYILSFNIGHLDFYYKRISSPKQKSMILGNSRSAQGLVPSVFDGVLFPESKNPVMFNFSFAANYSPYGEVYLNSIKKKVDPNTKNGVFILTVDPGAVSSNSDPVEADRRNSFLANLNSVTTNPNFGYILNQPSPFYTKLFYNMLLGKGYLHDNGWLEMRIPNDSISRANRLRLKLREGYASNYTLSEYRVEYLAKTIKFFQQHGLVFIVCLPVHQKIIERQERAAPWFNDIMIEVSQKHNVPLLNLRDAFDEYEYSDGSHLTAESAKVVSKDIADWIIDTSRNNENPIY